MGGSGRKLLNRFVSGMLAGVLLVMVGCTAPLEEPVSPAEPVPDRLEQGWSHEALGGEFRYDDGRLVGSLQGDQILLRVNNSEPWDLAGMKWRMEGKLDLEKDDSYSSLLAFWNVNDPWPDLWRITSFVREYGGVQVDAYGVGVNETLVDPQRGVWQVLFPGEGSGEYIRELEFTDGTLEPGNWRVWLAAPHSLEIDIEMELPELELSAPPSFSPGCAVVEASAIDATLMTHAFLVASVVVDGRWSVEVPEDALLFGRYLAEGAGLVKAVQWWFEFPDGEVWEHQQEPGAPPRSSPSGWDGNILASEVAGLHEFVVDHEYSMGVSYAPKVVYCIS